MRIEIEIPKEFESDYTGDKFKDFFSRVLCDIEECVMCGNYEKEIAEMFTKAFDESKTMELMQGDLISRSALLERLDNGAIDFQIPMPASHVDTVKKVLDVLFEQLEKTINEQPTAYSVEDVVARIGRRSGKGYRDIDGDYVPPMIETKEAIEIVRNGGKE